MNRRAVFIAVASTAGALGVAFPSPAAEDAHLLATSKAHKLQILADGGTAWCQPSLRLRMVLDADSPDAGNPANQIAVMNLLKTPIAADCKAAKTAELTVVEQGKASGTYKAAADRGWSFAAAPLQPAELSADALN